MLRALCSYLGIGATVILGACAHRVEPVPQPHPPVDFLPSHACTADIGSELPPARASDTLSLEYAMKHPDAAQAYTARRLRGGYLRGPAPVAAMGRGAIWMRDTSARQQVLGELGRLPGLALLPGVSIDSIEARQADWDGAASYDWLHYLFDRPNGVPGVNAWGIGGDGRIFFGLPDAESVPKLVAALERLGVPCGLVRFSVWGPVVVT